MEAGPQWSDPLDDVTCPNCADDVIDFGVICSCKCGFYCNHREYEFIRKHGPRKYSKWVVDQFNVDLELSELQLAMMNFVDEPDDDVIVKPTDLPRPKCIAITSKHPDTKSLLKTMRSKIVTGE